MSRSTFTAMKQEVKERGGTRFRQSHDKKGPLGAALTYHGGIWDHCFQYVDRDGVKTYVTEPYNGLDCTDFRELLAYEDEGWYVWVTPGWWHPGTLHIAFHRTKDVKRMQDEWRSRHDAELQAARRSVTPMPPYMGWSLDPVTRRLVRSAEA
jgi:hypothetical protein